MSTVEHPETQILPSLVAGERLDQATFHARYAAMAPGSRAELVGGVVSMPSPLSWIHGELDDVLAYWFVHYRRFTPGLVSGRNATTKLSPWTEVQPDGQLRIPAERGGQSRIVDGFVVGPPELVVEVGRSSRSFDLLEKKAEYERAGVREYLFVGIDPDEVRWFRLEEGRYLSLDAETDGILRSRVFPGLWLDPNALLTRDLERLIRALDLGLATTDHQAFVRRLTGI
jgi:Uma2 family endonuclease